MTNFNVSTIGFTKSTAQSFFERLKKSGVKKVIDVRLRNTSQLAGFAKAEDLTYLLKNIAGIDYQHYSLLAPTASMLDDYKKGREDWGIYQGRFLDLMRERKIEQRFNPEMMAETCLLCSEATPERCHRRLVCDYLNERWGASLTVHHL